MNLIASPAAVSNGPPDLCELFLPELTLFMRNIPIPPSANFQEALEFLRMNLNPSLDDSPLPGEVTLGNGGLLGRAARRERQTRDFAESIISGSLLRDPPPVLAGLNALERTWIRWTVFEQMDTEWQQQFRRKAFLELCRGEESEHLAFYRLMKPTYEDVATALNDQNIVKGISALSPERQIFLFDTLSRFQSHDGSLTGWLGRETVSFLFLASEIAGDTSHQPVRESALRLLAAVASDRQLNLLFRSVIEADRAKHREKRDSLEDVLSGLLGDESAETRCLAAEASALLAGTHQSLILDILRGRNNPGIKEQISALRYLSHCLSGPLIEFPPLESATKSPASEIIPFLQNLPYRPPIEGQDPNRAEGGLDLQRDDLHAEEHSQVPSKEAWQLVTKLANGPQGPVRVEARRLLVESALFELKGTSGPTPLLGAQVASDQVIHDSARSLRTAMRRMTAEDKRVVTDTLMKEMDVLPSLLPLIGKVNPELYFELARLSIDLAIQAAPSLEKKRAVISFFVDSLPLFASSHPPVKTTDWAKPVLAYYRDLGRGLGMHESSERGDRQTMENLHRMLGLSVSPHPPRNGP